MFKKKLSRKGQGLSLNVIIVAAIALIVLVVLIMVFTGRIAIFENQVGGEARSELRAMEVFYGDCHPGSLAETNFMVAYTPASDSDDTLEAAQNKAQAKDDFSRLISECKSHTDKDSCQDSDCQWR